MMMTRSEKQVQERSASRKPFRLRRGVKEKASDFSILQAFWPSLKSKKEKQNPTSLTPANHPDYWWICCH
jgi:hypothetical protein